MNKGNCTATVAAMGAMTATPGSGSGSTQTFTVRYTDPIGFEGEPIGWAQFLIAAATDGDGRPFCFVHYDRAGNGLWMYSSDAGFFLGPVAPGSVSNALDSSACSIRTGSAVVTNLTSGFSLRLTLDTKAPVSGNMLVFQRMLDPLGRDTGWLQTGTAALP